MKPSDVHETMLADMRWWYFARHFENEEAAKIAFDELQALSSEQHGEAWIGCYRILDNWELPSEGKARLIVVVGHIEDKVQWAARQLQGEFFLMEPEEVSGLIARRIRVLASHEALKLPGGTYGTHWGEQGIRVKPDGKIEPR